MTTEDAISVGSVNLDQPLSREAGMAHGILLLGIAILPVMAMVSLIPVLPLLMEEFASVPGAAFLVPMALTLPALCVALFSPVVGYLADRFGRRRMLIGSLILYSALGLAPIILTDLYAIIASRAGLGLAEAAIMTLSTTMLGDYFKGPKLVRWISAQVSVVGISAIVLIGVGGLLGEQFGSRGPFFLYVLAIPLVILSIIMLFEPAPDEMEQTAAQTPFPLQRFMPLIATTFLSGLFFYTLIVQLGAVLGLVGVTSPALIGATGALSNVGMASGSLIAKVLDRLRLQTVLSIAFALVACGYIGVSASSTFVAVTVFVVVAAIGAGILLPTLLTAVMKRLSIELRGRGTGLWTGAFFLAQFTAPLLGTLVARASGGLQPMLLIYGVLATVSMVVAFALSARAKGLGALG